MKYSFIKRVLDFIFSFFVLILISPLLIFLSLIIFFFHGWPVLFLQKRPGRKERPFKMIKFRTMTNKKDKNGNLLPDKQRITKLGAFLRKTSLDELPELFNVLKGDMSLVGPRPLLIKYLPYYTAREKARHNVRPGITGLSQISGRNHLSWDERLELDVQYVENHSLWLDIKILFKTVGNVLKQKDVVAVSSEIMPDFDDYRKSHTENPISES